MYVNSLKVCHDNNRDLDCSYLGGSYLYFDAGFNMNKVVFENSSGGKNRNCIDNSDMFIGASGLGPARTRFSSTSRSAGRCFIVSDESTVAVRPCGEGGALNYGLPTSTDYPANDERPAQAHVRQNRRTTPLVVVSAQPFFPRALCGPILSRTKSQYYVFNVVAERGDEY